MKKRHRKKPDYFFLLNMCYIHLGSSAQLKLWKRVYPKFESHGGRMSILKSSHSIKNKFGFWENAWQPGRIEKLAKYLRTNRFEFIDFLNEISYKDGLDIRDDIANIVKAGSTKTISTFIRDWWWKKDIFPIDTRVSELLNYLGLPADEDLMVILCTKAKINSRIFNRALYDYYDNCEEGDTEEVCPDCCLKGDCYYYQLMKS